EVEYETTTDVDDHPPAETVVIARAPTWQTAVGPLILTRAAGTHPAVKVISVDRVLIRVVVVVRGAAIDWVDRCEPPHRRHVSAHAHLNDAAVEFGATLPRAQPAVARAR